MPTAALIPALGAALVVAGLIGVVVGLHPAPEKPTAPASGLIGGKPSRLVAGFAGLSRRTRILLGGGLAIGVLIALVTGWLIAIVLVPAAMVGLPILLTPPASTSRIEVLEALEEWTRSLSGVLTIGAGLEQALIATVGSTPEPIAPQVGRLVARLRVARWGTEDALRAFADDLDDATGDLVAANLILGARRRGAGLSSVLEGLAESVAADVRARRAIEADRAKPRSTARWVTLITIGVLLILALTGTYIEPYRSAAGQLILAVLLSAYAAALVWMRTMATGKALPRFIGVSHGFNKPDGSNGTARSTGVVS